jgi:hypothetical protein
MLIIVLFIVLSHCLGVNDDVYVFNIRELTWTLLKYRRDLRHPRARYGHFSAAVGMFID